MISVPCGTDDIADAMISASQMIYASRMNGTDIMSYHHRRYIITNPGKPPMILHRGLFFACSTIGCIG